MVAGSVVLSGSNGRFTLFFVNLNSEAHSSAYLSAEGWVFWYLQYLIEMDPMKNITQWIDLIIEELVDPSKYLKDILLKVQVLAFKLDDQKLKTWIDNELNGYIGKEVPEYRTIPSAVFGNLIQDRGFGRFIAQNNRPLPIELLDKEVVKHLVSVKMTSKVAELEKMIADKGDYQINVPSFIAIEISKHLANDWHVDSAWQKISVNSIEGILSSVRSNLLNFLLELNREIGDNENFTIMERKKDVEKAFEKTIGTITGDTVNVNMGDRSVQAINYGDDVKMNIAKGKKVEQTITDGSLIEDLKALVTDLQQNIDRLNVQDSKEEILNEVSRIATQLKRSEPKRDLIQNALNVIYQIMLGITSNAYTPIIMDQITALLGRLG